MHRNLISLKNIIKMYKKKYKKLQKCKEIIEHANPYKDKEIGEKDGKNNYLQRKTN